MIHISQALDECIAELVAQSADTKTEALAAVAAADEGGDQNPSRGTIMTNDTPKAEWPVTRFEGYDEVRLEDEEHGLLAFISHNDTEDYWRVELNFQNAGTYHSTKDEQVAAARLMQQAARCVLELNGEQVAA